MSTYSLVKNLATYTLSLRDLLEEMLLRLNVSKEYTATLATCLSLMLICLILFIALKTPSAVCRLMSVLSTATASSAG